MRLYMQCPTGISGDMFLAGLADLGLDLIPLQDILQQAGLEIAIQARHKRQHGLAGSSLELELPQGQPLRRLQDIEALLDKLQLPQQVRERSKQAFKRLAQVEAEAHGVSLQEVHFHELGAMDTLVDILGAFWGLQELGVREVYCSPLPWFTGEVDCEHGRLPLPAPAVVRLLQGKPVYPTSWHKELITPTGALLVDQLVQDFTPGPLGVLKDFGLGWGSMELGQQPNCLQLFMYEAQEDAGQETVWVLESNLDHLTGEELGAVFEPLFQAGSLDVIYLPGIMKKNRCGGLLQVMCAPGDLQSVRQEFFRQTLSLGIRQYQVERCVLNRSQGSIGPPWGNVQSKRFCIAGEELERAEHEALQELARRSGRSLAQLRQMLWGKGPKEQG
ncbi:MAG: nickel pincer cofactor biosynthesis protein LarC [Desulfohalobiaceae bacterium]